MKRNRNTTLQNVWTTANAVLRGKFIGIYHTSRNKKIQMNNLAF